MKRIVFAVIALVLLSLAQVAPGQTNTFETAFNSAWREFEQGSISNVFVKVGGNYTTKPAKWGGELLLGYNLPKMGLPMEPYLVPVLGGYWIDNSLYAFSGTVSLKSDLHPLRFLAGTSTNGLFYDFTATPNARAGVIQNISGEQFGSITIPGKHPKNGQGLGAMTGEGIDIQLATIHRVKLQAWFEYDTVSSMAGQMYEAGLGVKFSPKGW